MKICPLCEKEARDDQKCHTSRSGKRRLHAQCVLKLELQDKHGRVTSEILARVSKIH
jgi:hypothetical protein